MDQIRNLLYSIQSGNAAESEDLLNSIMAQKAVSALDARRLDISKGMFGSSAGIDSTETLQTEEE